MRATVAEVHDVVTRLDPGDNLEAEHRAHVLGWLRRTDDVFRRVKPAEPLFLTVTETVGTDAGHIDVSLWYVVALPRDQRLKPDTGEFRSIRWWTRDEISEAGPALFDPHLHRFLAKLATAAPGR